MILMCSSCGGTMVYKNESEEITVYHSCTPARIRESLYDLRKLAWPWIPARQQQITFDEWSQLVRRVIEGEI